MEHSIGWYLRQKGQSQEKQEPELEAATYSQAEGDCSSPCLLLLPQGTPQYKPPVPQYEGPHCSQDRNPPELANDLKPEKDLAFGPSNRSSLTFLLLTPYLCIVLLL